MKKVSAKMFFTVLWSGVCQAVKWFFGLFSCSKEQKTHAENLSQESKDKQANLSDEKMREKQKSQESQCDSGKSESHMKTVAIVVTVAVVIAGLFIVGHWEEWHENFCYSYNCGKKISYPWNNFVYDSIFFHDNNNDKGYLYNGYTGRKTLKHVRWVDDDVTEEPLVVFCDGKKQGYFNKNTGKLAIAAKYERAFPFSEGRACVVQDSLVKFIDYKGNVVLDLDSKLKYSVCDCDAYRFHGGHCIVYSSERLEEGVNPYAGLMDTSGNFVIPLTCDEITYCDTFWLVKQGNNSTLYDLGLRPVIPMIEGDIEVEKENIISVTHLDHMVSKYDYKGNLLYDFCITDVWMLEYEKEDVKSEVSVVDGMDGSAVHQNTYHPKATARLRAYVSDGHQGLMTADGKMVTKPLYLDIHAIGYDLYRCEVNDGYYSYSVLVNGKGDVIGRND